MLDRRDLLIGGGALGSSALSVALKPHRHESLLAGMSLNKIVPSTIGDWRSKDVSDLVDAKGENHLMDKLYDQTIERIYRNTRSESEIMMLFAYGDTQSNDLQLHRPEVCYPAFGFEIVSNRPTAIPLSSRVSLPARALVAHSPSRDEVILYWSRLGDFLPTDGAEQRIDRLKTSLGGYIADGLLARLSMAGSNPTGAEDEMSGFAAQLIKSVSRNYRPALIGTSLANSYLMFA
jgi:EpsI family protein